MDSGWFQKWFNPHSVSQLWKEHVDEFIKLNFNTKFIRVATISRLVKITSTIKIVDHKFNSRRLI